MRTDKLTDHKKRLVRWVGWFSLFNYFLLVFFVARYLKYANDIVVVLHGVYVVIALLSHTFCLVLIPVILFFLPVVLFFPRSMMLRVTGVLVASVGFTVLLIDYGVYSQYRFHLNGMVFDYIINGGSDLFDFSWTTYVTAGITILGIVLLEAVFSRVALKFSGFDFGNKMRRKLLITGFFLLVFTNALHAWADAAYYRPITTVTRHIPLYKPVTAKRFLEKFGIVDLDENWKLKKKSERKIKHSSVKYPIKPLEFNPTGEPLNIMYIVIDSWRFDMLSEIVTPSIKKISEGLSSVEFLNHSSGGCGTRTGIFTMFYGIFGSYWVAMETEQEGPVFMEELIKRDYELGVFASAKLTTPAFNQTVFSDVSDLRLSSDGNSAWERDIDIVEDWERWFEFHDKKRAFFNFLFFDSAHGYTFPPEYGKIFTPMLERVDYHKLDNDFDPLPFINRYKTSLHFVDSLIGKVLNRLYTEGYYENTIIVITGDHGQEFNDNKKNYWGHASNFTKFQVNTPLVIHWPGKQNKKYQHLTNHIDIVPTIFEDLFGCKNEVTDYSNGKNLFSAKDRQWFFAGGGLSTHAIIENDRITELFNTGGYEIFTPDYSVKEDSKLHSKVFRESIAEQMRFIK